MALETCLIPKHSRSAVPILAIDTAAAQCAVAIVAGERVHTMVEPQQRGQSERLMPLIVEVTSEAGMTMSDLGAIAVTTGPGSFTGLRVGLAASHGLASALGIPAIGIDSFSAFAASLPDELAKHDLAVIVQSRRAELYWRLITRNGEAPGEPAVNLAAEIKSQLERRDVLLCGDGCETLRTLLPSHKACLQSPGPDPVAIARLGLQRLEAGLPAGLPVALYIRPPDAKLPGGTAAGRS